MFRAAPEQFDVILTNPPFGGKEGGEAQTNFGYKTSSTQVLFVQHVIDKLKTGGQCAIVVDEGVLFRTNESAFVKTKTKLLEECNLWCIVSLPGGVFTQAGAGVKTNILFFRKGEPTTTIWYYDLAHLKIRKRTPLTIADFDHFTQNLELRSESEFSWTVDIAARKEAAEFEAAPFFAKAEVKRQQVALLKENLKTLKTGNKVFVEVEAQLKEVEKEVRDLQSRGQMILDAVYDLKAVNPTVISENDPLTPAELIAIIEAKAVEVAAALAQLREIA